MPKQDPIPALKIRLAEILTRRVEGWSQEMAACLLGTDQPRVSDLRNGRLHRFSVGRLIRFVAWVGGDVSIDVEWTRTNFIGPSDRPARTAPATGLPLADRAGGSNVPGADATLRDVDATRRR